MAFRVHPLFLASVGYDNLPGPSLYVFLNLDICFDLRVRADASLGRPTYLPALYARRDRLRERSCLRLSAGDSEAGT